MESTVQHSPLYHQYTCGLTPIGGRTVIRRAKPQAMVGSLHIPVEFQGRYQEDWEAVVVANAAEGGWRMGEMNQAALEEHGHLLDLPPNDIPRKLREDRKIWKFPPFYVKKPELEPGTRILCCWLAGQPIKSANGYDYFLTDGEHAYKGQVIEKTVAPANAPEAEASAA